MARAAAAVQRHLGLSASSPIVVVRAPAAAGCMRPRAAHDGEGLLAGTALSQPKAG
eukprot:COSAG01_NODE_8625_length_2716_cov_2.053878_1_plen_55_part_10